jgi:REP element-mobilizing transposase RayT
MNEYQLGRQQTALEGPEHDMGAVKSVAFSPDGKPRAQVFHSDDDYHALWPSCGRPAPACPCALGFCLLPNHFHGVLWPPGNDDMARWMEWLLTTQVSRYRKRYGGSGHVFGRGRVCRSGRRQFRLRAANRDHGDVVAAAVDVGQLHQLMGHHPGRGR